MLSLSKQDEGITISDHSCLNAQDSDSSEFGLLSITPRACNIVTINYTKHNASL